MKNYSIKEIENIEANENQLAGKIVTIQTSDLSNKNLDIIAEETKADVLVF